LDSLCCGFVVKHSVQHGVMGSWLGRTGVIMLPKGDTGGPRRDLDFLQGRWMGIIASLLPRPSACGEEPHPTRGGPVMQNTVDVKE
jgi:hypothetical protein